jgi:anti-anti-sigma factor
MPPQQLFHLESTDRAQVIDLLLPEILDSVEFDRLNDALLSLVQESPGGGSGKYVIDLSRVAYMGSAMLGLMVNLRQRIKTAGGTLVLSGMPPTLLRTFRTCCMERLFVIVKTRAEALRY